MTDMNNPLAKVHGLGSAKDGTHHWWVHRITAVANIPLVIFLVTSFVGNAGKSHADWVAWLQQPLSSVFTILFMANMFYHLRIGMQVLIEDYVHEKGVKLGCMITLTFACIAGASLAIFSILKIAFGG